jgi:hypothetical protein
MEYHGTLCPFIPGLPAAVSGRGFLGIEITPSEIGWSDWERRNRVCGEISRRTERVCASSGLKQTDDLKELVEGIAGAEGEAILRLNLQPHLQRIPTYL